MKAKTPPIGYFWGKATRSSTQMNHHNLEMQNLYLTDFYAWTQEQAKLLKQQQWQKLDLDHLVEEIESLGRKERQEFRNRLSLLIAHLLKWHYQPEKRSRSWLATIRVQRREVQQLLLESPSLQSYRETAILEAYANSRDLAAGETNLPFATFPVDCPYSVEDILGDRFFPGFPADAELMD